MGSHGTHGRSLLSSPCGAVRIRPSYRQNHTDARDRDSNWRGYVCAAMPWTDPGHVMHAMAMAAGLALLPSPRLMVVLTRKATFLGCIHGCK